MFLYVPAGSFNGIVGSSGSGKSTIMKLLPRLYEPEAGRILLDGYDISKLELASVDDRSELFPKIVYCSMVLCERTLSLLALMLLPKKSLELPK